MFSMLLVVTPCPHGSGTNSTMVPQVWFDADASVLCSAAACGRLAVLSEAEASSAGTQLAKE
jgi:hypothetical protein